LLSEARRYPKLSSNDERRLAHRARRGDALAAQTLVLHNLRLVLAIALQYRRAWTELVDLVQEGTIGLIEAVRRWEASLGARFSTYAAYWIRAYILQFIMTNARLVSIANTRAGRKLFFRLEKERRKLLAEGFEPTPRLLAARLELPEHKVAELAGHVETPEVSLDSPPPSEAPALVDGLARAEPSPEELASEREFRSALAQLMERFEQSLDGERERAVWREHVTAETPVSLAELGKRYGVSKQRMGQIADRLKRRFRAELLEKFGTDARVTWLRQGS
jgi:RNA polymerase sigma-32 factor